jgi:hypothetical protein
MRSVPPLAALLAAATVAISALAYAAPPSAFMSMWS